MNNEGQTILFRGYQSAAFNPCDEFGNPVIKTKWEHPYSYDPFVIWRGNRSIHANSTVYSDRMIRESKYNKLSQEIFGDVAHVFYDRSPEKIELFLQKWYKNNAIKLVMIMECCNVSSGYPLWRFDFQTNNPE